MLNLVGWKCIIEIQNTTTDESKVLHDRIINSDLSGVTVTGDKIIN